MSKVILVLTDGMRPDGLTGCGAPYLPTLLASSRYTLTARTVMPSCTLPCHMSLFHSVAPDRHGILSNTYAPQVRPVSGLIEQLDAAGKKTAFFYTWEELRDLARPGYLDRAVFINQHRETDTDTKITDAVIPYINAERPDFVFLYLGETDEVGGHDVGWMSETYLGCVAKTVGCVERLRALIPAEYDIIFTADHGGHGRSHGSDAPEDMTIPIVCCGPDFTPGEIAGETSIMDIAPTITALLGAQNAPEWEGRSLLGR